MAFVDRSLDARLRQEVSSQLRKAIEERGMTRAEAAATLSISKARLYSILSQRTTPSLDVVAKLINKFGISLTLTVDESIARLEPASVSEGIPPPKRRGPRVFLCHASEDKSIVRDLHGRLRKSGFEPWLDTEELLPGQDWDYEIKRAVRESDAVVVCLSSRAIRKSGYVQKEIAQALDVAEEKPEATIFIIPALLDSCTVPERLRTRQWVDLGSPNGYQKLVTALHKRADELKSRLPRDENLRRGTNERHEQILSLIRSRNISTLDQLRSELQKLGTDTGVEELKNDEQDLRLTATIGGYRFLGDETGADIRAVVQQYLWGIRMAGNALWLRTPAGYAAALGFAIEREGWDEVLGIMPGDDVVLIMTSDDSAAQRLRARIEELSNT